MDQKAFKKAGAVTSCTPVKEKANLVIEFPLNVRHGSAEYWLKKIINTEAMVSDF